MTIKSFLYVLRAFISLLYIVTKAVKLLARCSLLIGAYSGDVMANIIHATYNFLEVQAARRGAYQQLPLVVLAFTLIFSAVDCSCSSQSIIHSDLKACETLSDGTRACQMFSTAEITLQTLQSESCLWFADKQGSQLFSLKIKLDSVTCAFNTERLYFTFPVKAKHISQISCAFNEYCGRGVHCHKQRIGKTGLNFESETLQSREYPGLSQCSAATAGNGCFIVTRAACSFSRTWYEPDLIYSYEVSKIHGHSCKYHISVHHSENNTVSRIALSDSAYTNKGIKIDILGAFDQSQLYVNDLLVKRVADQNEAYLTPACERNHPQAQKVGSVQANSSYTKDFIFDPLLTQCDFFENTLRCTEVYDSLNQMRTSKIHALPLQKENHLLNIRDGKLSSTLLYSSAVRVQLTFSNYLISVQSINVCPQFDDYDITVTGCYSCQILARLTFKAHSSCDKGLVTISFQQLTVYTQAIELTTEPQVHIIKFLADTKCYSEKLCLKGKTLMQCQTIEICTNEPSLELINLNLNYTKIMSAPATSTFWDLFSLPNLNSSLFIVKLISSTLVLACVTITAISAVLTCCCKRR